MTYGFPHSEGGGEGGPGATAFTDLTDAPGTITANAFVVGNETGDAVEFSSWFAIADVSGTRVLTFAPSTPSNDVQIATNDAGNIKLQPGDNGSTLYGGAVSITAGDAIDAAGGGAGSVYLSAGNASGTGDADGGSVYVFSGNPANGGALGEIVLVGPLKLASSDIPATDTAARLTVGETSYGIAKAIQVKIGADTHYWPLFGGEDAGPAPAPSIVETIVANGVVVGNDAGDALVMSAALLVTEAGRVNITANASPAASVNGQLGLAAEGNIIIAAGSAAMLIGGDASTGTAGPAYLTAGDGTGTASGGAIEIFAGTSDAAAGGPITVTAGDGATHGGDVVIVGGSAEGAGANGGDVSIGGGSAYGGGARGKLNMSGKELDISLSGGSISINSVPVIVSQNVPVSGVGTLTFTHGLLTGFTPE